ncbi:MULTISPECIES: hypothetical protein [Streptomyces]|uniref:DUF222 domain-containing protein n=1 Tax=Streptomyces europaeiscabiei TaxID=146819 RepID=A0ABU4NQ86_9ACTN|nr:MULTISPECIES: hypothetical protein [Streptomyces]MBP5922147.1 hypothetical protein [Streptomyces sp. LBUM 1483]MDX3555221.1 hypothetical protein [Streptomyces europaeiscabiei]MDX3705235.1 hypothetical protein [Streptomyces europaeiscabiei]MDX3864354.1 hypothetical protein [Streptomyces europaeiscabiei]MDX3871564.1 hypothetical protein [Streptomyces europaeiscabiei]
MSSTDESSAEARMVVVDGREAIAYVILRPGPKQGTVLLEAAATEGTDQHQVAQALRHISDQWAPRPGLQGVLSEIAVRRGRQRTAFGGDEHHLPDGTGQHPETIDADVAQMARDQAAEFGHLDWLHVVRAAAAGVFAECRQPDLRAALVDLAAYATGWIQALDHRADTQPAAADHTAESVSAAAPVHRHSGPAGQGDPTARVCRHPLRVPAHAPEWLSCDIHRAGFSHKEDCPGHGTPDCIAQCAGGEPTGEQLLGLAVELLDTAPRVGDLLTPGGAIPPTVARALSRWLTEQIKWRVATARAAAQIWGSCDHPDAVEWLATGPGRPSAAAIELARELLGRTT